MLSLAALAARRDAAPAYTPEEGALDCPPVQFRWVHQAGLLNAAAQGASTISAKWHPRAQTERYELYLRKALPKGQEYASVFHGTTRHFVVSGLAPNTEYELALAAIDTSTEPYPTGTMTCGVVVRTGERTDEL